MSTGRIHLELEDAVATVVIDNAGKRNRSLRLCAATCLRL